MGTADRRSRRRPLSRQRVWEIVEAARPDDLASRRFDLFLIALVTLNVVAVVLESMEPLAAAYRPLFHLFEAFSVAVFTIEYAVRLWSCTADPRFARRGWGRLRFALTPMALVDLAAVAPAYLATAGVVDLRALRGARLIRLVRVAKVARYSQALRLLRRVVARRRPELALTFGVMLFLLVVSSCLVHHVEHEAQPEVFPDIPSAMWWAVATLTTVGYGDTYPVTAAGKLIGSLVAVLGIGFFALPAGILGSGFVEEAQRGDSADEPGPCPHCGAPAVTAGPKPSGGPPASSGAGASRRSRRPVRGRGGRR